MTDKAIEDLQPWRSNIPLKIFSSRIRFLIRVNDLREETLESSIPTSTDDIMGFFNPVLFEMIRLYSEELNFGKQTQTWRYFEKKINYLNVVLLNYLSFLCRDMLVYKNILRAIENIGINCVFVFKYYTKGYLTDYEKLAFFKTQVTSLEYLTQVSNFAPQLRKKIQDFQNGMLYIKLQEM